MIFYAYILFDQLVPIKWPTLYHNILKKVFVNAKMGTINDGAIVR